MPHESKPSSKSATPSSANSKGRAAQGAEPVDWDAVIKGAKQHLELNQQHQQRQGKGTHQPQTPDEEALSRLA
jgi:hypothetical protein